MSFAFRAIVFLAATLATLLWFYRRMETEHHPVATIEAPPGRLQVVENGGSPSGVPLPLSARSRLKDPATLDGFEKSALVFESLDAQRSGATSTIGARRRCYAGMMRSAARCMQYLYRAHFSLRNDLDAERELVAYTEACERYFDERIRQAYSTCYTSTDEVYPLAGMRLSATKPRASNDLFA